MKMLVIGFGEVGQAVYKVLADKYEVKHIDVGEKFDELFDVIHVTFPYSKDFEKQVTAYTIQYLADDGLVIVHSTVPVGTCGRIGAVHSPIRGVHPNLEQGVRVFVKTFGGFRADEAAEIFKACGVKTACTPSSDDTEAAKLWCTTAYFVSLIVEKEMFAYCKEKNLDFDFVYRRWTEDYNKGYTELGMGHVQRPVLNHVPGGIGGHCLIPNAKLLKNWLGKLLLLRNSHFKRTGS